MALISRKCAVLELKAKECCKVSANNCFKLSHHITRLKVGIKVICPYISGKVCQSEKHKERKNHVRKNYSFSVSSAGEQLRCGQSDKVETV